MVHQRARPLVKLSESIILVTLITTRKILRILLVENAIKDLLLQGSEETQELGHTFGDRANRFAHGPVKFSGRVQGLDESEFYGKLF